MPIVTPCSEPNCEVLTIGPWCVEHDWTGPRPTSGTLEAHEARPLRRVAAECDATAALLTGASSRGVSADAQQHPAP